MPSSDTAIHDPRRCGDNGGMAASRELGGFLRARRARVQPSEVGLPAGSGIRRTPGLRREELAALAGVSVDYYTRLEQGKETNPSGEVLAALAAVLRLDADGRAHLYAMANHVARRGPSPPSTQSRTVRPAVRQLLETLRPCPASVLSRTSDVLAANPESLALYPGLADWPVGERNTVRYVFTHPAARSLFDDWYGTAASAVANLRTVLAHDPDAQDLAALINQLTRDSPDFAQLWDHYDVTPRRSQAKVFHHPVAGDMILWHEVLRLSDDGQRLGIYQARPGSPDHDALTLLALLAIEAGESERAQAQT
jgi:transcriptional regulator with XRE-family HTH domain